MAEVFLLHNNRVLEIKKFKVLLQYVSCEKKQRILKCYRFADAQRVLLADILCRSIICSRRGFQNNELIFSKNEYGKPGLLGHSYIHFNLSHAGNWIVFAIDDAPVGIDVELVRPIDFGVAKRFFHNQEYAELISMPKEFRLNYFYKLWTLKESYVKAEGKGLFINLKSFIVNAKGQDIKVNSKDSNNEWFLLHRELDDQHQLAMCSKKKDLNNLTTSFIALDTFFADTQAVFGSGLGRILPPLPKGANDWGRDCKRL